jgi:hypothetical protein
VCGREEGQPVAAVGPAGHFIVTADTRFADIAAGATTRWRGGRRLFFCSLMWGYVFCCALLPLFFLVNAHLQYENRKTCFFASSL